MTTTINDRDFGRLEGKVDSILAQGGELEIQVNAVRDMHLKLEQRVSQWEQRAVGALAVAGFVGFLLTAAASWVFGWFRG